VLNAANEVAVDAFVNGRISFLQISETVRRTLERHQVVSRPNLEQVFAADTWARNEATA
jgi:1-deoxy-D-xylulose-5-phosphate reductoisomerase